MSDRVEFTPEEIERSLTALALCGGNTRRTARLLEQDTVLPHPPSKSVLHNWKHEHADRYQEIVEQRAPEIEKAAIHDYRAIVANTNHAHLELVDRTLDQIDDLDASQAAQAAKNLAIAGGVAADKLLVFTDRPNVIHSKPDPEHLINSLTRAFGLTPPEHITDAHVVDETEPPALTDASGPVNAGELAA